MDDKPQCETLAHNAPYLRMIEAYMLRHHVTMSRVAVDLGVSHTTVCRWFQGHSRLSRAKALMVKELCASTTCESCAIGDECRGVVASSESLRYLLEVWCRLDVRQRGAAESMVRGLADGLAALVGEKRT